MKVKARPHILKFNFEAGTSRGVLTEKKTWFVSISHHDVEGVGECGPLKGLSIDDREDFEEYLLSVCKKLQDYNIPSNQEECFTLAQELVSDEFPSIRFAVETALLDLLNGGNRVVFNNAFIRGEKDLPINGLIWMGRKEFMLEQIKQKIEQGYDCIKLKIGAIDFKQECEVLEFIRKQFNDQQLTLRLDANGAFTFEEAMKKLKVLSRFNIHSIEQPIRQGQLEEMAKLSSLNIIPIALDEELIGISSGNRKAKLLEDIQPHYIILKPTLLGGIKATQEWIRIAEERNIGWWITSALESNVGLNAIAQFTSEYQIKIPQGLGTGQLYTNNIPSPLQIKKGLLSYGKDRWGKIEL